MRSSLVLFSFLLPCIHAAPVPANEIDSLLSKISKHITKAIPINNIPSELATKSASAIKVVLNPKIIPNPKATPKPKPAPRRSLSLSEEPNLKLVARQVPLAAEDANTLPINPDQVTFFDASLDASLPPSPPAAEPLAPRALKSKSSPTPIPIFTPPPLKIKVPITTTPRVSVPVVNPKAPNFSLVLDVKVVNPPKSRAGAPVKTRTP